MPHRVKPSATLITFTANPEREIEYHTRRCYASHHKMNSDGTPNRKFLTGVRNAGHLGCFEFAHATFEVVCKRNISHQWERSRTQSYLEMSQRYVKLDDIPYICEHPDSFFANMVHAQMTDAEVRYNTAIDHGVKPEDARDLLPTCTATNFSACANFTNWRKFIQLRATNKAQKEIRLLSHSVLRQLHQIAPSVFQDLYDQFLTD